MDYRPGKISSNRTILLVVVVVVVDIYICPKKESSLLSIKAREPLVLGVK